MVKAKDFLKFLCEDLDYRFFSGTAAKGSTPLYKSMSPDFMHYIPAAHEQIALGMANGSHMAGFKSAIIVPVSSLANMDWTLELPVLVLAFKDSKDSVPPLKLKTKLNDEFKRGVKTLTTKMANQNTFGVVLIEGGQLI